MFGVGSREKPREGSRLSFTIPPPKIITVEISGTFLPGSFMLRYTQFKIVLELHYVYIHNNLCHKRVDHEPIPILLNIVL